MVGCLTGTATDPMKTSVRRLTKPEQPPLNRVDGSFGKLRTYLWNRGEYDRDQWHDSCNLAGYTDGLLW